MSHKENRNQFTFYRSYWEALRGLGKRDRQAILEAVLLYALDGALPEGLSNMQQAMFALIRPTLDSGRKKAKSGEVGARQRWEPEGKTDGKPMAKRWQADGKAMAKSWQSDGKAMAKPWQTDGEKEKEIEKEGEIEIEKEIEIETEGETEGETQAPAPPEERAFTAFWDAYPCKIGQQAAWEAWTALRPDPRQAGELLAALEDWKRSGLWRQEGGRFIPRAAKWLSEGYWHSPPASGGGQGRELDADERAAILRMMEADAGAGTP